MLMPEYTAGRLHGRIAVGLFCSRVPSLRPSWLRRAGCSPSRLVLAWRHALEGETPSSRLGDTPSDSYEGQGCAAVQRCSPSPEVRQQRTRRRKRDTPCPSSGTASSWCARQTVWWRLWVWSPAAVSAWRSRRRSKLCPMTSGSGSRQARSSSRQVREREELLHWRPYFFARICTGARMPPVRPRPCTLSTSTIGSPGRNRPPAHAIDACSTNGWRNDCGSSST